jgi:hypothetical protein
MDRETKQQRSENWIQEERQRLTTEIDSWPKWMQELVGREMDRLTPAPVIEEEWVRE